MKKKLIVPKVATPSLCAFPAQLLALLKEVCYVLWTDPLFLQP